MTLDSPRAGDELLEALEVEVRQGEDARDLPFVQGDDEF